MEIIFTIIKMDVRPDSDYFDLLPAASKYIDDVERAWNGPETTQLTLQRLQSVLVTADFRRLSGDITHWERSMFIKIAKQLHNQVCRSRDEASRDLLCESIHF